MGLLKTILGTYLMLSICLLPYMAEAQNVFRVTDFGAKANGVILNSAAIQKAIDAANASGGGTVSFEKGIYLSGSIELKSNVILNFEKEATLLGSTNPLDYHGLNRWKALILVDGNPLDRDCDNWPLIQGNFQKSN